MQSQSIHEARCAESIGTLEEFRVAVGSGPRKAKGGGFVCFINVVTHTPSIISVESPTMCDRDDKWTPWILLDLKF